MKPETRAKLWDAERAATFAISFLDGVDFSMYESSIEKRSAVERQLEIVGEAFSSIRKSDPAALSQVSEVSKIIGMRNILIHEYMSVSNRIVWEAVTEKLPTVLREIQRVISSPAN
ncbi:MAG: DUF86 domain-containing protein [Promicromonosporaceae bacterium]|nr:DUF86 domain-containing protein [Promicromonosporaceae bacterium]